MQETNQEVPGWLQGMGARAPSFGGGKRRGGGGNRFGGQDFRRDNGGHCKPMLTLQLLFDAICSMALLNVNVSKHGLSVSPCLLSNYCFMQYAPWPC